MKKFVFSTMAVLLTAGALLAFPTSDALARRGNQGCCSYHRGVSHCDTRTDRLVCNDGTYSPTCRCGGR